MHEDTREEFLQIVNDESDRLTNLIEDLLEISHIESGKMKVNKEKQQILNIIKIIKVQLTLLLTESNLEMIIKSKPDIPMIPLDKNKMIEVIQNLVSNSIKFTPKGGKITVEIDYSEQEIIISIIDTGMGIPQNDIEHVFDRFYRVYRPGKEIKGTGLGLAIVRQIIELHDGTIKAQSRMDGAEFIIKLPYAKYKTDSKNIISSNM
jgi:signal transduction histidine kinase